jgi:hypothetical protein
MVPNGVVDEFEIIQIDKQQGAPAQMPIASGQRNVQSVQEESPVWQASQRVIKGQFLYPLVGQLAGRNVKECPNVMRGLAAGAHGFLIKKQQLKIPFKPTCCV